MKKAFKMLQWVVIGIVGFIAIVIVLLLNWNTITNFKIGLMMDKFTEMKTPWVDIDFTTVVKGETHYLTFANKTPYPALAKYQIHGIYAIEDVILVYGSNTEEAESNWDAETESHDVVAKNEQAYIFRSDNNGKAFEKISLGHGIVEYREGSPILANNVLYVQVDERDTKKTRYYRSTDLGKTWAPNDWKPSFAWSDGTMFIENEDRTNITMSQDNGKTWHPLSGVLKEFYTQTKTLFLLQRSLRQLNDHTLVGMTDNKEFLFLDLKTMKIEKIAFETPENKKIVGFTISNHQLGLELEEYTLPDQTEPPFESGSTQTSYYFPKTKEYVNLPKQLPYQVYWDVKDNYIGGFMHYSPNGGYSTFGTIIHVYTLDRGKHWKYEILDKYSYMSAHAYINGALWFVAAKGSAADVFLTKGKVE